MTEVRRPRGRPRKPPVIRQTNQLGNVGLHEKATQRLRELILTGELSPGVDIVETELSQALGISRTPVREALKLLATEGLIELRKNRSPRVPELESDAVIKLFEAIACIERVCAELAAVRISEKDLLQLREYQEKMEHYYRFSELEPYFAINQKIHRMIVACSENRPLQDAHESMYVRAELVRRRALQGRGRWDESVSEHRAILDALTRRNAAAAGALLSAHVERTGRIVNDELLTR